MADTAVDARALSKRNRPQRGCLGAAINQKKERQRISEWDERKGGGAGRGEWGA